MGLEQDAKLNYFHKRKINRYEALFSPTYDHSLTTGGNTLHTLENIMKVYTSAYQATNRHYCSMIFRCSENFQLLLYNVYFSLFLKHFVI